MSVYVLYFDYLGHEFDYLDQFLYFICLDDIDYLLLQELYESLV